MEETGHELIIRNTVGTASAPATLGGHRSPPYSEVTELP